MFLPIRDDNPTVRTPYMTYAIIAVNALVYLFTDLAVNVQTASLFSLKYGLIPYELTNLQEISAEVARQFGLYGASAEELSFPILGSLFTSMFMHGGFMHLAGNMLYLWIYGNNIEDYFGPWRFLAFYLVGGVAATGLHVLISPNSPTPLIGASGAISATLGAYLTLYPRARVQVLYWFFFIGFAWLPASLVLGFYFVIQVFNALVGLGGGSGGGVAWFAHLGGFAFGWALLKLIVSRRGGPQVYGGDDRHQIYRVKF